MGGPVQSVREHRKVTDDIDDAYMETIRSAASMRAFLVSRTGGNKREQFLSFYQSFYELFEHTRYMDKIDVDEVSKDNPRKKYNLVKEIEGWFDDCEKPRFKKLPMEFIRDGINLFSAYRKKLIANGAITIKR